MFEIVTHVRRQGSSPCLLSLSVGQTLPRTGLLVIFFQDGILSFFLGSQCTKIKQNLTLEFVKKILYEHRTMLNFSFSEHLSITTIFA